MMKKYFYITALFFFISAVNAQTKVYFDVDTNQILIGKQIHAKIGIDFPQPDSVAVQWPVLLDTLATHLEIINRSPIDTLFTQADSEKMVHLQQTFTFTSFEEGTHQVPALDFLLDEQSHSTDAFYIDVFLPQLSPEEQPADIKDIIDVTPSIWDFLVEYKYYVLSILLALAVLSYVLYKIYKNRKNISLSLPKKEEKAPHIPPHIKALEKLKKLEEKKVWQNGKVKLYHSELTEIIRLYLEERFDIHALEKTSDEIMMDTMLMIELSKEQKLNLKKILTIADFVKFAKRKATSEENELSMSLAVQFVEESAEKPENIEDTNA